MLDRPEITTGVDALYLSPHFDDAAFSCGAQIHARARRGERVLVVTVFAGAAPPPERWSSFAASLHRLWGLDRDDPVAPRRAEERRALDVLGASGLELDLPDAIYRADAAGRPLYPTLRSLFRRERAEDRALQAALEAALRELPESPFVAAPLAIGDHVDHRMVARAARASVPAGALWLYEDYPYAERWLARRRARTGRGDWSTRVEEACEEDVLAKCHAISCYASQLGSAFGDRARLERRVRRFLARRGGERLWQASSGNAE
ncbi:MAG TPA: PIG-L family deacetylase [Thermoanaerobaculia bacterium]|nr:PIG-L family deacetylase [Thermoanaerobaculia bacterium]